ncbi:MULTISPECIES: thioredoxin family protein [Enterobacteriaceae]|jgi:small redox-active disulfide protein 2|uniref:Thiol-disulfide isomerase and thioredoxins family protein n=2 Tax=Enterobacter cloacae TaxID=550 RepID=A0A0H3CHM3_ENTCC|nr:MULTISPECIES: thioredoxin family protein [Enterobacteriaceae]AUU88937.1 thioredoxin family protein [Enterobacteriaceae bacterium ENNIH3]AUV05772.1 thioredoxin family protein [Enterobacteriaceae bacterium ENNIH2]ELD7981818.1 thioredoxin family protein [Enterobacter hormaechei]MDU4295301.1 thioredoxin family protein [Enterobacter asburiae]HBM3127767.1 thioredoxin family protein [Klebsiella michiganensis]HCD7315871.1 thioredoxin family protein [Enterobacter chengduensis]HED1379793.1 thioredo
MKHVKVLGTGCSSCKTTIRLIQQVADERGVAIQLEKVESLPEIMKYKVMSTPAVVINDIVVHAGGIPSKDIIESWL